MLSPSDIISGFAWIDESRIISVRRHSLKALLDIHQQLMAGKGPKNSGEFITMLLGRLFEPEHGAAELEDSIDSMEETVMESPDAKYRQGITDIRKQGNMFWLLKSLPNGDVIASLRELPSCLAGHGRKTLSPGNADRVIRYQEDMNTILEQAQVVKDKLPTALSTGRTRISTSCL